MAAQRERLAAAIVDAGAPTEDVEAYVDLLERSFRQARALVPAAPRPGRPRDRAATLVASTAHAIFALVHEGRRSASPVGWAEGDDAWTAFLGTVLMIYRGRRPSNHLARAPAAIVRRALLEIAGTCRN